MERIKKIAYSMINEKMKRVGQKIVRRGTWLYCLTKFKVGRRVLYHTCIYHGKLVDGAFFVDIKKARNLIKRYLV